MIGYLGDHHGIEREAAYALVSIACDLRVHELVDAPNWVVGCFLPEAVLRSRPGPDRPAAPLIRPPPLTEPA